MPETLADKLASLLQGSPGLTATQLHDRLRPAKEQVPRGFVDAILRTHEDRFGEAGGRWYLSTIEPDDPLAVERDLRERLAGRRIIAEIGLDASLHERSTEAVKRLMHRHASAEKVARLYPAVFATYLAGHGVYGYAAGDFYGTVAARGIDQRAGPPFIDALKALHLETFEDLVLGDNALRYVGPILSHGGIPKYCLSDFFDLLLRDANKAGGDARELLAFWRTRKSAFFGIDTPVRRFLLFGGELARDLLDRCLDLIREFERTGHVAGPAEAGLPPYIVEAFHERPRRPDPGPRSGRSRLPRPAIRLDPWDPSGLVLVLPAVNASPGASWRLHADGQLERFRASAVESRQVRLRPAKSWSVSLDSEGDSLNLAFEGLDDIPGLLFEPATGRLLPAAAGVRADDAWVLTPADVNLEGIEADGSRRPVTDVQELPERTGEWSGFRLRHIDLRGVRALSFIDAARKERRVSVRPGAERPRLVGVPVLGVSTADGLNVFPSHPAVELPAIEGFPPSAWKARVGVGGIWHVVEADDEGSLDLEPQLGRRCEVVDLVVRGPLGSDLRTRFALVPGLEVERPDRLLFPGDRAMPVRLRADVGIDEAEAGDTVAIPVPDGTDTLRCRAGQLDLEIKVAKVLWAVARASEPDLRMADNSVVFADDDLVAGEAFALVVRCGRPDVHLSLSLWADGRRLQRSEDAKTSSHDGRWAFDLGRFADAVRLSDAPSLWWVLDVGQRPLTVANLRPSLRVTRLDYRSRVIGDHAVVELDFDEERPHRNRVARLWSRERPWEAPVETSIPDGEVGKATFAEHERIPPGNYLAEIAIDDGWTTARRPMCVGPGVATIKVGTPDDVSGRLERLPLDDVSAVLEIALTTGRFPRRVEDDELPTILPGALQAVKLVLATPGTPDLTARQLWAVAPLLWSDPACLAVAVTDAIETGVLDPPDLLLLTVALGSKLRPPPSETGIDEQAIRGLWEIAPAMAAALDLSPSTDEAGAARAREFLGWDQNDGAEVIKTGEAVDQRYLGMSEHQLQDMRRSMELVPGRLFHLDAWVASNFEWLLAHKTRRADARAWWREAAVLVERLDATALAHVAAHLAARKPPTGTEPWAALPQATLAAAVHIVIGSPLVPEAQRALAQAVPFAPRLVARDLALARALTIDVLALEPTG